MKQLFALLLLMSSMLGFATTDQKAKSILDQVSQKTKAYKSITADFQFSMDNADADIHEVNKGTIIIQGDAYKLTVSGVEIFSNGTDQWTYMKEANEVNISDVSDAEESVINPATIFTIYEQGYTNTYLGEFTTDSKATYKIEMIPEEVQEFSRVILEVDQNSYQILGAVMTGTDNNTYTIKVTKMNTSKDYPASTFVFDTKKHSDVDVIDMR